MPKVDVWKILKRYVGSWNDLLAINVTSWYLKDNEIICLVIDSKSWYLNDIENDILGMNAKS